MLAILDPVRAAEGSREGSKQKSRAGLGPGRGQAETAYVRTIFLDVEDLNATPQGKKVINAFMASGAEMFSHQARQPCDRYPPGYVREAAEAAAPRAR